MLAQRTCPPVSGTFSSTPRYPGVTVSPVYCQPLPLDSNTMPPPPFYTGWNATVIPIWQLSPVPVAASSPNSVTEGTCRLPVEGTAGHRFDSQHPVGVRKSMGITIDDMPNPPVFFRIKQVNGQRIYGPPPGYRGPEPPRGSEVFVGGLPPDCFERELVPLFETIANIYQVRLMMHFSGAGRGFGFVEFFTPQDASRAIAQLKNHEIRPGTRIGVVRSFDSRDLLFDGLSLGLLGDELAHVIGKRTDGMTRLVIQPSKKRLLDPNGNARCYFNQAVVEFESHKAASMARRNFFQKPLTLHGYPVSVTWWNSPPGRGRDH